MKTESKIMIYCASTEFQNMLAYGTLLSSSSDAFNLNFALQESAFEMIVIWFSVKYTAWFITSV